MATHQRSNEMTPSTCCIWSESGCSLAPFVMAACWASKEMSGSRWESCSAVGSSKWHDSLFLPRSHSYAASSAAGRPHCQGSLHTDEECQPVLGCARGSGVDVKAGWVQATVDWGANFPWWHSETHHHLQGRKATVVAAATTIYFLFRFPEWLQQTLEFLCLFFFTFSDEVAEIIVPCNKY